MRKVSRIFRSIKRQQNCPNPKQTPAIPHFPRSPIISSPQSLVPSRPARSSIGTATRAAAPPSKLNSSSLKRRSWCVYLIASTNHPIKTYVGVTTNFCRRLKQHNGEMKGGAKASRAGRPWVCACIVRGFIDRSEACKFEAKWKSISRKLPRKRNVTEKGDDGLLLLLQHRHAALEKVRDSLDCGHLKIDWKLDHS